jgi:hypothetical protein
MSIVFIDRSPTGAEVEKLRLILSTYQDGTGMLSVTGGKTLPGWRDFERSVALCFGGIALESKAIYDVLLPDPNRKFNYGISCKMRNTLRQVDKDGRVTIELSNAAGEFWALLEPLGINQQNYAQHANTVGKSLIERVERWHYQVDVNNGGSVDTAQSIHLSLQYDARNLNYQLFHFPILLPKPETISWEISGRHLVGKLDEKTIIEWYGLSGGQLKYYPHYSSAVWMSDKFTLEPIPENTDSGIMNKVLIYFPHKWEAIKDIK